MTDWLLQGSRQVALLLEQAGTRGQVPVTSWTLLGGPMWGFGVETKGFFSKFLPFTNPLSVPG